MPFRKRLAYLASIFTIVGALAAVFQILPPLTSVSNGQSSGCISESELSNQQKEDLRTLINAAIKYLIYHNGRFSDRITRYIPREYVSSGLFFFPREADRFRSRLQPGERAAVADEFLCFARVIMRDTQGLNPKIREFDKQRRNYP